MAPSCLASSNLDGLVSIAKIREAFLVLAACQKVVDARRGSMRGRRCGGSHGGEDEGEEEVQLRFTTFFFSPSEH